MGLVYGVYCCALDLFVCLVVIEVCGFVVSYVGLIELVMVVTYFDWLLGVVWNLDWLTLLLLLC